jgi:hypothetical protein
MITIKPDRAITQISSFSVVNTLRAPWRPLRLKCIRILTKGKNRKAELRSQLDLTVLSLKLPFLCG